MKVSKIRVWAARLLLIPFLAGVVAGFVPMWHEITDCYIERGRREILYTTQMDPKMLRVVSEAELADSSVGMFGRDPQLQFLGILMDVEREVKSRKMELRKSAYSEYDSEGALIYTSLEDLIPQYDQKLHELQTRYEAKWGAAEVEKWRKKDADNFSMQTQMMEERLTPSWGAVLLWGLLGILFSMGTMTLYALVKAKLYGFRAWIEIASFRAVAAGITWVGSIWSIYPQGDPRDQLRTALKFASGWLTALLWLTPIAAAGQSKSSSNTKGKDPYVLIDETQADTKPNDSKPKSKIWAFTLDLKNTLVTNGDVNQTVRLTAVRKSDGLLFETVDSIRETDVSRVESMEAYPGLRVYKDKNLTVNAITGARAIVSTNKVTDKTSHIYRGLAGLQLFFNRGRMSLSSPVNRLEIPIDSPNDRLTFSHTHQLLFKLFPRWQAGEEISLSKTMGRAWQKTIGFMVRFKPSPKAPALEFGYFNQPDFTLPARRDHAFRTRAILSW